MDITKELKQIELNEIEAENVLADIFNQKEMLRKREYLSRVISIANELEDTIKSGFFKVNNIGYLNIGGQAEYNGNYKYVFIQLNYDKEFVLEFSDIKRGEYSQATKFLATLTDYIGEYESDLCSDDIKKSSHCQIKLTENIKENFFNILLSEELKKLRLETNFNQHLMMQVVKDIVSEKVELKDKEHILETVNLANKLEKLVEEKFFKELQLTAIEIVCDYDYEEGYKIRVPSVSTLGGFTQDANQEQIEFFEEFFSSISEHDSDFISKELMDGSILELKQGIAREVINLLLSSRLKTIFDYNKMKVDLPDNNGSNTKKIKI